MSDPIPAANLEIYWRPRAFVFYATAGILVLAAVVLRTPVPLFLALPILLAPVAAGVSSPRTAPRGRLVWNEFGAGSEVRIKGELTLDAPLRSEDLEINFSRPAFLEESAPKVEKREGASAKFEIRWKAPYPCLATIPPPTVFWRDPWGLVERSVFLEAEPMVVQRYPPELSRLGAVRLRRTTVLPGEVRARSTGSSGDFFSIRASAPGDTPRQINWRATARRGRLLANEFYVERTGDLLLLLDLRPTELGPVRDAQILSVARAAALGIAQGFLNEKSRVALGLYAEFLTAIPLGSGRLQRFRIREALLGAKLATTSGPSERLAVSMRRYFPPGVTTILISSMADEASVHLLPHLRRRGFPVYVLSPSPLPLLNPPPGRERPDDPVATRLLQLIRRTTIQEVWKEAPMIEWTDYWSLGSFVHFLSTPPRNRGAA